MCNHCIKKSTRRKTNNRFTENKEVSTLAKDVTCSVDSCVHWEYGNKCVAEKIEVNNHLASAKAYKSDETLCKTFKPQNDF